MIVLDQEISSQTKVNPGDHGPHFIQWTKLDVHGNDLEVINQVLCAILLFICTWKTVLISPNYL